MIFSVVLEYFTIQNDNLGHILCIVSMVFEIIVGNIKRETVNSDACTHSVAFQRDSYID